MPWARLQHLLQPSPPLKASTNGKTQPHPFTDSHNRIFNCNPNHPSKVPKPPKPTCAAEMQRHFGLWDHHHPILAIPVKLEPPVNDGCRCLQIQSIKRFPRTGAMHLKPSGAMHLSLHSEPRKLESTRVFTTQRQSRLDGAKFCGGGRIGWLCGSRRFPRL